MFFFVFVLGEDADDGLEKVLHAPSSSFSLEFVEQTSSSASLISFSIGGSGKGPTGGEDGVVAVDVVAGGVPNINCQRDAKIPTCCTCTSSSFLCTRCALLLFVDGMGTGVSSAAATNKNVTGNN